MTGNLGGANTLVFGLARSGVAAARLLRERGARVTVTDSGDPAKLAGAIADMAAESISYVPQAEAQPAAFDLIVLSPGVPADLPQIEAARAAGVRVIGEVELAGWYLRGPVIGITGSNGKTTTTALTGHILGAAGVPVQVGGNIGTAVCAMVASSRPVQWNVLELSSFQLETIETFTARVAACLNLTPDHLDRHKTLARYIDAKARLFETQQDGARAVLNAADPVCVSFAARTQAAPVWFSSASALDHGAFLDGGSIRLDGDVLLPVSDVPIRGRHNLENTMAAACMARLAGAAPAAIADGIRSFRAVEHRLEFVRTVRGVHYYNDSKATNVDAALKALDAFDGGIWMILGGKDKGSDYMPLAAPLASKARAALLIGAAAPLIRAQLATERSLEAKLRDAGTVEQAIAIAAAEAGPGDAVLLAPACASFDQFENYEHRGRVFKASVRALPEAD